MPTLRKVLTVIMDGIGERQETFGNAVAYAHTPNLTYLRQHALFTTLQAHGSAVGMPSDSDLGNSEVGHNSIGAGRVFAQGATLVQEAIASKRLFASALWKELIQRAQHNTLHFIGLLSDGNVHSHEQHLYALLRQACTDGAKHLRVHVLFDGRDVGEKSAEVYVDRLEKVLAEIRLRGCDAWVASGGGRMRITMDRYEADWAMVERGWKVHVLAEGPRYPSLEAALKQARKDKNSTDQYIPEFVVTDSAGTPRGPILDDDGVVLFNFRGDRAIELSRAFEAETFTYFDRVRRPNVLFAGMTEYTGDEKIPRNFLVSPPLIDDTLGEHLATQGIRQFACSETQKYGHVTYFWNGNRTGSFDPVLETYVEIPSDRIVFDRRPWMKASEITEETIAQLHKGSFDFGRINLANGDMVGHTGNFSAAVNAVSAVDLTIGLLIRACRDTNTILIVTADHGNCEEMFDAKPQDYPHWYQDLCHKQPPPKTSHTLSPVPCFIFDPSASQNTWQLSDAYPRRLSSLANTILTLMGLPPRSIYDPSLIRK